MDKLKQFECWAARARTEASPQLDVAPAVLRRLRAGASEPPLAPTPWMWAASAACAGAATVAAVIGYAAWIEMAAPWSSWLSQFANWGTL